MPGPAHAPLANLLFTMQEVVRTNPKNGRAAPEVLFGQPIAQHFGAVRQALGLANKWATAEETAAALAAASPVAQVAPASSGMSVDERALADAGDIDLAGYDIGMEALAPPVPQMCWRCQNTGRDKMGACTKCGAVD